MDPITEEAPLRSGLGTGRRESSRRTDVARAVAEGLGAAQKWLPSWLLYDAAGSALFERITHLPEYYLSRAEAQILSGEADRILDFVAPDGRPISIAEIGAGSAVKTEALLAAALRARRSCLYLASDIAEIPLRRAQRRLKSRLPGLDVRIVVGTHADAGPAIAALEHRQLLLWIGSSIGNYADREAAQLLRQLRRSLRDDAVLLFGTDLVKDPHALRRAYDDAEGVTAAFSRNLLVRLNRELDAEFNVSAFRHVVTWDAQASNVEVYLQATRGQQVWIGALGRSYGFRAGERIHTETCAKYDAGRVDAVLNAAGFARASTLLDPEGRFAVHLARIA